MPLIKSARSALYRFCLSWSQPWSITVKAFDAIREVGKRYLHYWTSTRDDWTAKEAVHIYEVAIQLVLTAMEIGFTNGQITLAPPLVEYLKARGTIRPDEKDE